MPKKPILSLSIVEDLKSKGLSQSEIARQFGVTRAYISWIKSTYGGSRTPREIVLDQWPFEVPMAMGQASVCRRLRDHAEYMATGGKGMTDSKLRRLRSFYERLDSRKQVVEFDPGIPPQDGVSIAGGWAYRPRRSSDGDLLIRENDHTRLTKQGRKIWRFPREYPDV